MARATMLVLIVCSLAFAFAGCSDDPAQPDGDGCPSSNICGTACCDDETETCVEGVCQPKPEVCDPECGGETPDCAGGTCKCNESSCETGKSCVAGACVADECSPACEGTTPKCVDTTCRCEGDSCGEGFVCNATGACEPEESECTPACEGSTPDCDNGTCRCNETSCETGKSCVDGACVTDGCTPACGGTTPKCVDTTCHCEGDSCGDGFVCNASGACEPVAPGCTPACNAGEICVDQICYGERTTSCPLASTYGPFTLTVDDVDMSGPDYYVYYVYTAGLPPTSNPDLERMRIEMWDGLGVFKDGIEAGTFSLSDDELSLEVCGLCLIVWDEADKSYMPASGSVTITSIGSSLEMTLDNVAFREVTLNGYDGPTTPVDGGCTSTMREVNVQYIAPEYCSPLDSSGCMDGMGCYLYGTNFECGPAGTVPVDGSCSSVGQCIPGSECFNNTCHTICASATAIQCDSTEICQEVREGIGICITTPPNDTCGTNGANATALTLDATISGDTTLATNDYGHTLSSVCFATSGYHGEGPELVYSYTPAASGVFEVTVTPLPGSSYDTLLWMTVGTCGEASVCVDATDLRSRDGYESLVIDGIASTTYYFHVDSYSADAKGMFTIGIASLQTCDPLAPACGAGEGCYRHGNSMFTCQPAGSVPPGGRCTSSQCIPGAQCLGDGTCATLCPLGGSGVCTGSEVCEDMGVSGIGTCQEPLQTCDPLDFTGCGAGLGCYSKQVDGVFTYTCQPAGTSPAGTECDDSTGVTCVPGTDCVGDNTGYKCRPFCNPTGSTPPPVCVAPLTCYDWQDGGGNCMEE